MYWPSLPTAVNKQTNCMLIFYSFKINLNLKTCGIVAHLKISIGCIQWIFVDGVPWKSYIVETPTIYVWLSLHLMNKYSLALKFHQFFLTVCLWQLETSVHHPPPPLQQNYQEAGQPVLTDTIREKRFSHDWYPRDYKKICLKYVHKQDNLYRNCLV